MLGTKATHAPALQRAKPGARCHDRHPLCSPLLPPCYGLTPQAGFGSVTHPLSPAAPSAARRKAAHALAFQRVKAAARQDCCFS